MDGLDSLFENRSVVGAKLEGLLEDRKYTKTGFCKECGISRPTLNKILNGTIRSEAHFEKHMEKILRCLSISPDALWENAPLVHSRTRQFRTQLHIDKEEISAALDIPVRRLEEIEAGAATTNAELRDLAVYLGTSTHCILAQNVFYPQTTKLSYFIDGVEDEDAELSGFWGHVGILPSGTTQYLWYPITSNEAEQLHYAMQREHALVPCMDNKLLYLNLRKIKSIVLLEDSCDPPYYYNWDPSVEEEEIPLVVYEVLSDYISDTKEGVGITDTEYSPKLREYLDALIEERKWTEEDAYQMVKGIRIRYADGSVVSNDLDVNIHTGYLRGVDIIDAIDNLDLTDEAPRYLAFTDWNEAVTYLNMDEIAMLELPLLAVEKEIMRRYENLMRDKWE